MNSPVSRRLLRASLCLLALAVGPRAPEGAPTDSLAGFTIDQAPSEALKAAALEAAAQARRDLQERWPRPLSDAPLRLVWFDSIRELEVEAGRRADGVLALADTARDRVLLNGPLLRQAGLHGLAGTLRHEMVHIQFARAGVRRLPRWLEEGLAMRLADQIRWGDGWLIAADRLFGKAPASSALWGAWPDSPAIESRAYRQAASLTDFFIRRHFADKGEQRLLTVLLHPRRGPDLIDELWRPHIRTTLYREWRNEEGRIGALISFVTSPSVLFGGVCVALLIAAFIVKRRRARAIAEGWAEEGPYFSQSPDDDEDWRG